METKLNKTKKLKLGTEVYLKNVNMFTMKSKKKQNNR